MMGGKDVRVILTIAVLVLLVTGTFVGDDDNFPFGPFRMYSTSQELDGEVRVIEAYGLTKNGAWVGIPFDAFGLRRAEIEGQLRGLAVPPVDVLRAMDEAYAALDRGEFDVTALQLRERTVDLQDGLPAGETVDVLGTWERRY